MYHLIVSASEVPLVPFELAGVSIRLLEKDPSTGAATVLTEMQPGSVIPKHWHRLAEETVFVLAGELVERGKAFGPGTFFSGKAGTTHGPHGSRTRCKLLTHFTAELGFQPAETGSAQNR